MKPLKLNSVIYIPMTCNILTVGHIKVLESLPSNTIVGLLTAKGLRGYKKELVPFKDRKFILSRIFNGLIVPQDSLDPSRNLKKYRCDIIASGDGFEISELKAIKKLNIKPLHIKLKGEKSKKYSSSMIVKRINESTKHKG